MFFPDSNNSVKLGRSVIKNVFYFGESPMLDCNQFILVDDETGDLALFDSGNGLSLKGLFEGMGNLGLQYQKITRVFLTHEHVDHVLGLYPLIKLLKENPPTIYAFGETTKILREGTESKIFPGNLGISPTMFGLEIIPLDIVDLNLDELIQISHNTSLPLVSGFPFIFENLTDAVFLVDDFPYPKGEYLLIHSENVSFERIQESWTGIDYFTEIGYNHLI